MMFDTNLKSDISIHNITLHLISLTELINVQSWSGIMYCNVLLRENLWKSYATIDRLRLIEGLEISQ
jgi:hypothetical protein